METRVVLVMEDVRFCFCYGGRAFSSCPDIVGHAEMCSVHQLSRCSVRALLQYFDLFVICKCICDSLIIQRKRTLRIS